MKDEIMEVIKQIEVEADRVQLRGEDNEFLCKCENENVSEVMFSFANKLRLALRK